MRVTEGNRVLVLVERLEGRVAARLADVVCVVDSADLDVAALRHELPAVVGQRQQRLDVHEPEQFGGLVV